MYLIYPIRDSVRFLNSAFIDIMDYRSYIRQLIADILNKKIVIDEIKNPRDFFFVQTTLMKMGKIDMVRSMGELAGKRNKNGGWQFSK